MIEWVRDSGSLLSWMSPSIIVGSGLGGVVLLAGESTPDTDEDWGLEIIAKSFGSGGTTGVDENAFENSVDSSGRLAVYQSTLS